MILKNVEKTGTNQVKLEIVCERDEFQAAVEKSYKKNATRFNSGTSKRSYSIK